MAAVRVTVPRVELPTVTTPVGLIDTVTVTGVELVAPNCRVTVEDTGVPLLERPLVATSSSHRVTVIGCPPTARGLPVGNVDWVILKMHEP